MGSHNKWTVFLSFTTLLYGCGQTHKSSTNKTTETTVASSTSLAITYPEGMAVSSTTTIAPTSSSSDPTTVNYASGSLAIPTSLTMNLADDTTYDPTKVPPKDKIVATAKRLKGEADDCLPPYLFNPAPPPNINCYNSDGDLSKVFRNYTNPTSPTDPQFPNASGVTSNGEACLAAYSRAKIADVAAAVDQAQALVEGMICAAYKHDKSTKLPKINATLDLAAILADIAGGQRVPPNSDLSSPTGAPPPVTSGPPPRANFRFMKAEIKRLDNEETRAKFLTEIAMEVNGEVREIRLVHLPSLSVGNNDYVGRLSIRSFKVQRDGLASNKELYTDINYMMDLDTNDGGKPKTRYRLYHARYSRAALQTLKVDPFAGIGQLDINRGATFDGTQTAPGYGKFPTDTINDLNQTIDQIEQIDYAGNPITNEGLLAYWKNFGGNYREAARGLVADRRRESPDSTRLMGCAVSGAALGTSPGDTRSIRMAQREKFLLVPSGYFHPQGDPNTQPKTDPKCQAGDCQHAPFVYKQCYRQDDAGLYRPSENQNTTANFDVINVLTSPAVVKDRLPPVDGKLRSP